MAEDSVWVKVVCKKAGAVAENDEDYVNTGDPLKITPRPDDVDALKKKVKERKPNDLANLDADRLVVFPPGADYKNAENKLNSWDPVPQDTTGPNPLIVVAPASRMHSSNLAPNFQQQQQQQQWFFLVKGTINRPSSHAGARHALFRFASEFSGIYPQGLNADTAFFARSLEGDKDRRLLDFAVVFATRESAQQFINSLASYVKLTEGQIFFCDDSGVGNAVKNPAWQLVQPYESTAISPILEADYAGRNHGDMPPKDSPVVQVMFSSHRSSLTGDTDYTADVTLVSQSHPIFRFQRVEEMSWFGLADAESVHIFPSAKCLGVYEWLNDKDYNRLALSRDLHINFDGTGRGCGKRQKTAQVLAFRPLRPCNGYKITQLSNFHERVYEIPLEIVLNDSNKANALLTRLGKTVEIKAIGSLTTLVGPDLKVCYPTERRVHITKEDMQCDDGTTKQEFVNKVPGVDDLGTCWSIHDDQSLEAAEVLEKCLLWNYNDAMETWSLLG